MPDKTARGPGRFRFGYAEIAQVCGLALTTVRSDLRLSSSVELVAQYIMRALGQRGVDQLLDDAAAAKLLNCSVEHWQQRWPRFDAYRCLAEGCATVLLEPGACPEHGGSPAPLGVIDGDHVFIRLGRGYTPICVLFSAVGKAGVKHLDGNLWNNRPSNLAPDGDGVAVGTSIRRWEYGYAELATLLGMSEEAVRQAVSRGMLNPASLDSICSYWSLR